MELPKNIKDEIWEYCRVNDISNIDEFIVKMVRQGFTSEKFGATPWDKPAEIKEVEVEKIVEKEVIKEVPVEVVREVEKIVEKEVFVTDDEVVNKLQEELDKTKVILKDTINDFDEERIAHSKILKEKDEEITKLLVINKEQEEKVNNLIEELEAEKAKPKQEEDNDIYGEGKQGFFGSNISDLWNKKKK